MLDLASATPREWLDQALADMDLVLLDHAHCEKKAASTAVNLIFRYQDRAEMMVPLSALAREDPGVKEGMALHLGTQLVGRVVGGKSIGRR